MGSDFDSVGISMPDSLRERLDEMVEQRQNQSVNPTSRSEVAREALTIGLTAMRVIDDEYPDQFPRPRDKKMFVQTALLAFEDSADE